MPRFIAPPGDSHGLLPFPLSRPPPGQLGPRHLRHPGARVARPGGHGPVGPVPAFRCRSARMLLGVAVRRDFFRRIDHPAAVRLGDPAESAGPGSGARVVGVPSGTLDGGHMYCGVERLRSTPRTTSVQPCPLSSTG